MNTSGLESYVLKRKSYPLRLGVATIVKVREEVRASYTNTRGDDMLIGLS